MKKRLIFLVIFTVLTFALSFYINYLKPAEFTIRIEYDYNEELSREENSIILNEIKHKLESELIQSDISVTANIPGIRIMEVETSKIKIDRFKNHPDIKYISEAMYLEVKNEFR